MGVVAGSGPLRSHRDDIGQGGASGLGAPDVPTAARPLPVLRVTTLSEPLFQGQPCNRFSRDSPAEVSWTSPLL